MLEENTPRAELTSNTSLTFDLRLDYQKLASQILVHLRGDHTQRGLSQLMGYSFNQIGKWESGATQVKWNDFFKLCEVLQIPIEKHIRYSFWTIDGEMTPLSSLKAIENNLKFAESASTLKKWLKGTQIPDFAEVLRQMGRKSPVMFGWLSLFVNCEKIPLLKTPYESFLKNIDSVLSDPLVVYVSAALHLEDYKNLTKHDDSYLAEHAACTKEEVQHALKTMLDHGLASFNGRVYEPSSFDFSFAGLRHSKLRGLTKHTTALAANRYSRTQMFNDPAVVRNASQSSVRVVALSKEASKEVVSLIAKFHAEIGEIVKRDHLPKDNVQVMLIHSFASNINSKIDTQI